MKAWILCTFLLGWSWTSMAQGTAMPPFTFSHQSIEFADGNRSYTETGGFTKTDTLSDQLLLNTLIGILKANPELVILLQGHTAANEPNDLGEQRAHRIKEALMEEGIAANRLEVENRANQEPKIPQEVVDRLPTELEQEIAQQRNRRVEVKVVRNDHQ